MVEEGVLGSRVFRMRGGVRVWGQTLRDVEERESEVGDQDEEGRYF